MELAPDITSEDLKVFLEEAEEHLQLLDEDIIRLEKEKDNTSLLQEIFRAAHTLKGSSAMLGHTRMSELAHAMESVLDKVRKGTLIPGSDVVDALLHSLDGLRILKEELVSAEESGYEIATAVAELKMVMETDGGCSTAGSAEARVKDLALDDDRREKLQSAVAAGQQSYNIQVQFKRGSSWTAVRCFQVIQELSQVGEIIASRPSMDEIEQEKAGFELYIIFTSFKESEHIEEAIKTVCDIDSVTVGTYTVA